jgi:hypothetical protein
MMDGRSRRGSERGVGGMASHRVVMTVLGMLASVVALATLLFGLGSLPSASPVHLTLAGLVVQLDAHNVATAVVDDPSQDITGTLHHPLSVDGRRSSTFSVAVYPFDGIAIRRLLASHGVTPRGPAQVSLPRRLAGAGVALIGLAGIILMWIGLRGGAPSPRSSADDGGRE